MCVAADIISAVEFSHSGELLATGDRGGRIVIFQQEQEVRWINDGSVTELSGLKLLFEMQKDTINTYSTYSKTWDFKAKCYWFSRVL